MFAPNGSVCLHHLGQGILALSGCCWREDFLRYRHSIGRWFMKEEDQATIWTRRHLAQNICDYAKVGNVELLKVKPAKKETQGEFQILPIFIWVNRFGIEIKSDSWQIHDDRIYIFACQTIPNCYPRSFSGPDQCLLYPYSLFTIKRWAEVANQSQTFDSPFWDGEHSRSRWYDLEIVRTHWGKKGRRFLQLHLMWIHKSISGRYGFVDPH